MSNSINENTKNNADNNDDALIKAPEAGCPTGLTTMNSNKNPQSLKSRIQQLQQRLVEGNTKSDLYTDRSERNKELEELASYRLVNFDECRDEVNKTQNKTADSSNPEQLTNEFPTIPSDLISVDSNKENDEKPFECDDTVVSSEWRDETLVEDSQISFTQLNRNEIIFSPPAADFYIVNESSSIINDVNDVSVEKIHSLDRTMESLEELDLLPLRAKTKNQTPTIVSKVTVNSEPPSPGKMNISKREVGTTRFLCSSAVDDSYNETFSQLSHSPTTRTSNNLKPQLVKTSTKFLPNSPQNPSSTNNNRVTNYNSPINYNDSSFNRHMVTSKNSSPLISTPLNNKDDNHNLKSTSKTFTIFKSIVNSNDADQVELNKPAPSDIPSSFNDSDSYASKFESPRIETRKEYHAKRRSLSATKTIDSNTVSITKLKSNVYSSATNFSIGYNPTLNSYDHPDDISRNLSFSTVDSACALHNNGVRDTLVKKYYAAAKVQQQIIAQSENVLNLICEKEGSINDSARLPCCLDAESLLLLSTYRRNLFLHKATKLKRSNISCKCDPESNKIASVSVSVSDISIQISDAFTKKLRLSQPESFYYFLAIVTFGDSDIVFCTSPVSIYDLGQKNLLRLPGSFANEMRCDESVNIEVYARTLHNKKDSSKLTDILKLRFRKRSMKQSTNSNTSNSEFKNRECAFRFAASCAIPISEKKSDALTLFNRVSGVPLGPQLFVELSFQPNFESYAQGFLSVYKMEGGLPCWKRYWCVLQQTCLKMWNWKDDDPNDFKMSVDLTWDADSSCKLLPQHICARSNTLEINLTNDTKSNHLLPRKDFISKPTSSNTSSNIYKYILESIWLSADNANECGVWLSALSLHQARYREWKKAVSSKHPTVPSRRLV